MVETVDLQQCQPSVEDPRRWDLKVKKEYILDARPSSLPPLPPEPEPEEDNRDRRRGKQKRKRRPRDARMDASEKLCLAIVRGDECPFGEKCKFSHDVKEYLVNRPDDISTVEGGCPLFNLYGKCVFGAMCRLGSCHLNMATGQSLTKEVSFKPKPILNVLTKDVQVSLRKKKYPFVTERNDSKSKRDRQKNSKQETVVNDSAEQTPDPLPLPVKERKLVDFSGKVYVAPLTTVGNLPFRRIMKKFGADITCGGKFVSYNSKSQIETLT